MTARIVMASTRPPPIARTLGPARLPGRPGGGRRGTRRLRAISAPSRSPASQGRAAPPGHLGRRIGLVEANLGEPVPRSLHDVGCPGDLPEHCQGAFCILHRRGQVGDAPRVLVVRLRPSRWAPGPPRLTRRSRRGPRGHRPRGPSPPSPSGNSQRSIAILTTTGAAHSPPARTRPRERSPRGRPGRKERAVGLVEHDLRHQVAGHLGLVREGGSALGEIQGNRRQSLGRRLRSGGASPG